MHPVTVLSIAGSDSGGGAGIQADLRTFAAFGVHGTTAVTAVTAQNTLGVNDVAVMPTSLITSQVRAVTDDFRVAAVKTGMLGDAEVVQTVAELARENLLAQLVVDPVLVSTTRHSLMRDGGIRAYREALFPHATVITPNLSEACALCGVDISEVTTRAHMISLGTELLSLGPQFVLVKGGHLASQSEELEVPDVLVSADGAEIFEGPRIFTSNDHGTGCTLSAAICARLALGSSVPDAVRDAKVFVSRALTGGASWRLGAGRGPLDHLGWNQ